MVKLFDLKSKGKLEHIQFMLFMQHSNLPHPASVYKIGLYMIAFSKPFSLFFNTLNTNSRIFENLLSQPSSG